MEYYKVCANIKCKKAFVTTRSNKLACCAACSEELNRERNRKWAKEQYLKRKIDKARCKNCGKEFTRIRGKLYCSDECRAMWLENNKNKVKCRCEICGADFMSEFKTKFCSENCALIGYNLGFKDVRKGRKKKNALSEYALRARECGMSYGKYVGIEYIEKLKREGKYWCQS